MVIGRRVCPSLYRISRIDTYGAYRIVGQSRAWNGQMDHCARKDRVTFSHFHESNMDTDDDINFVLSIFS